MEMEYAIWCTLYNLYAEFGNYIPNEKKNCVENLIALRKKSDGKQYVHTDRSKAPPVMTVEGRLICTENEVILAISLVS